jgi:hypothetical protein
MSRLVERLRQSDALADQPYPTLRDGLLDLAIPGLANIMRSLRDNSIPAGCWCAICALFRRQNRRGCRVPMEKTSVRYRTDFAVAKESGSWTGSERFSDDARIVIRDAK